MTSCSGSAERRVAGGVGAEPGPRGAEGEGGRPQVLHPVLQMAQRGGRGGGGGR